MKKTILAMFRMLASMVSFKQKLSPDQFIRVWQCDHELLYASSKW